MKKINLKRLAPHSNGRVITIEDWQALTAVVTQLAENQNEMIDALEKEKATK
jgi:hypothetical protein